MTTFWLAVFGMGVVTFALRASLWVLPERVRLPEWFRRSLRYVPAAVLTAIYAPELFLQQGAIALTPENEKLLAGLVACAVAWHFRLTFVTIAAGLVSLHLFAWLL